MNTIIHTNIKEDSNLKEQKGKQNEIAAKDLIRK